MYLTFSKILFDVGIPAIPLFNTTKLPAVPQEKILESNQSLNQKNWRSVHTDKACGVPTGVTLPNDTDYMLMALAVDNSFGDLKMRINHAMAQKSWNISNAKYTYYVCKTPVGNTEYSQSFYLPGRSAPLASILTEDAYIPLQNHLQIPTPDLINDLKVVDSTDFIRILSEFELADDLYSEPYQLESQKNIHTLGQLNVKMRYYIAHFCYDFLLKGDENTALLPVLHEIDALFDSYSQNFKYIPPSHHKQAYFQAFYSMVYEEKMLRGLLLPPNWDAGLGAQYREKYSVPFSKRDTQQSFETLQKQIFHSMSEAIGNDQKMLQACQRAMEEIARSFSLTKLEQDQLKRFISRQSGMKLNMSKMDSQISALRNKHRGVSDAPEVANRLTSFLSKHTEYRYDSSKDTQRLFRWLGTHWEPVEDFELMNIIHTYFNSPVTEKNHSAVKNILSAVKNTLSLPLRRVIAHGVNFHNGFVSATLELLPHDPDMGLTYTLPHTYSPSTSMPPKFQQFVTSLFGAQKNTESQKKIDALQEAMAATFFNATAVFQRAFLLYGDPETGKSQMLSIIRGLIPAKMRASIPPDSWGDTTALSGLSNKLLNLCGELSEDKPINSQRFKDIVDGSEVTLVRTQDRHQTLYPIAAHWFASNHLPKTKDFSDGFTRRWLIIHLDNKVKPEDKVLDIGNKIVSEESNEVISWALQAYPRLTAQGEYTLPESHSQISDELARMNNNVRFFFDSSGLVQVTDPQSMTALKTLPKEELVEELRGEAYISGTHLYTLYRDSVRIHKNGPVVNEVDFFQRTRELSNRLGFLQVVGRDSDNRIAIRFYGLGVSA